MKNKRCLEIAMVRGLPVLFFAAAWYFWAVLYAFHLNYQEQFQLFLFTPDYLFELLGKPGGFADYLGRFLTQFNFYSQFGALVLAALLMLLQQIVWSSARKMQVDRAWQPLSFIPPVLYWALLCDENYMMGGLVAMIILASSVRFLMSWKENAVLVWACVLSPLLYWLAGGVQLFFALFALFYALWKRHKASLQMFVWAVMLLILTFGLPQMALQVVPQFPLQKLLVGVEYYRYPVPVPPGLVLFAFLLVSMPFLMWLFSRIVKGQRAFLFTVSTCAVVGFSTWIIYRVADFTKEEVMAYDFHIRMRRWDRAIALADKHIPQSPLAVTCLNLALAKQDLLGERMFAYYQKGEGGLIPDFKRDFTVPLIAGEVYYHLGLVNTAQRFAFEAMEALPDYQKSVRVLKRLAETNIVNGHLQVARKYLTLLSKTLYYRKWANMALQSLDCEEAIAGHVEWNWLREARVKDDFLFSEREKEKMLGMLLVQNRKNRMAFEYLIASCLLRKDLQQLILYYPLSKPLLYSRLPKSHQEALLLAWSQAQHEPGQQFPYPLSKGVLKRFLMFRRRLEQQAGAARMKQEFGDTYWYYFYFRN